MIAGSFGASDYRAWKSWDDKTFGQYTPVDAVTFRRELEVSGIALTESIALLEIGFGNGQFALWAKAQGWLVVGVELDPELVTRANQAGIEAHGTAHPIDTIAGDRRFDVVVAFDVFEHQTLGELLALLAAVRRCLKPGGRIIARFPSGDSPFAGSVQHSDLTHKITIGTGIVHQLARFEGFRVVQIRSPVLPIFGVGLTRALRRLIVLSVRTVLSGAINLAFHDGQPLVTTRNMVVVLEPN
jgi:SAM-dependent methyltransferase